MSIARSSCPEFRSIEATPSDGVNVAYRIGGVLRGDASAVEECPVRQHPGASKRERLVDRPDFQIISDEQYELRRGLHHANLARRRACRMRRDSHHRRRRARRIRRRRDRKRTAAGPLRSVCGPGCREQPGTGENSRPRAPVFSRMFPRVAGCARRTNESGSKDRLGFPKPFSRHVRSFCGPDFARMPSRTCVAPDSFRARFHLERRSLDWRPRYRSATGSPPSAPTRATGPRVTSVKPSSSVAGSQRGRD